MTQLAMWRWQWCVGIGCIILVADVERFGEFRGHQSDLVPHHGLRTGSVLRSSTGFHADQTRPLVGKVLEKCGPFDGLVYDLASLDVDVMHLKDILRNVHSRGCLLHDRYPFGWQPAYDAPMVHRRSFHRTSQEQDAHECA